MNKIKLSSVPFNGTAEQEAGLLKVLSDLKGIPGALMQALQKAQEIYGYLPYEVQKIVSDYLSVPLSEVFGVVTFYSQFTLSPKGKNKVGVCLGTACYVRGSQDIIERVKTLLSIKEGECTPNGKFSLDATRCIGCCGLAPVMTVNDDVYGKLLPNQVDAIIAKYKGV